MDERHKEIAAELDFVVAACGACRGNDPACANCEGAGTVWRNGAATLSNSGMSRLARWTLERRGLR